MSADVAEEEEESGRSSPLMAIIFLVVAAMVSAGAGFGMGQFVFAPMISAPAAQAAITTPAEVGGDAATADDHSGGGNPASMATAAEPVSFDPPLYDYSGMSIVTLNPITTNIAMPAGVWLRAEMVLAVEGEADPVMVAQVESDILAYLRTIRLNSLSTPSGFQHIVTDLRTRAADRSNGVIRNVFVTALLVE